jgi:hypothetical protein
MAFWEKVSKQLCFLKILTCSCKLHLYNSTSCWLEQNSTNLFSSSMENLEYICSQLDSLIYLSTFLLSITYLDFSRYSHFLLHWWTFISFVQIICNFCDSKLFHYCKYADVNGILTSWALNTVVMISS